MPEIIPSSEQKNEYTNTDADVRVVAKEIAREELAKEAKAIRKDFITLFSLFAGFLTFTVLQIQSLIQQTRMSLIMGASAFFVGVTLVFVLSLHDVVKGKVAWREFVHPVYIFALLIFLFSFECFWYATHQGRFSWPFDGW